MSKFIILLISFLLLSSKAAAITELSIVSLEGDYIGQGETHLLDSSIYEFNFKNPVHGKNEPRRSLNLTVRSKENPSNNWSITLDAGQGNELKNGLYHPASRFPFNKNEIGFDFSGNGRGCNKLIGQFQIQHISFDENDKLESLFAGFAQHCEKSAPFAYGHILFNLTPQCYQGKDVCDIIISEQFGATIRTPRCNEIKEHGHWCENNTCEDLDGDGWGWTGSKSCKMNYQSPVSMIDHTQNFEEVGTEINSASNNSTTSTTNPSSTQSSTCIDSDGDGWGWDGSSSCRVSLETSTVKPTECIDSDGDGWGWDGVKSCKP